MALDVPKPKNYRRGWNGGDRANHLKPEWTVTVCAACNHACCWQGVFYCEDYKSVGTKEITIAEARKLNQEHPDYWLADEGIKQRLSVNG